MQEGQPVALVPMLMGFGGIWRVGGGVAARVYFSATWDRRGTGQKRTAASGRVGFTGYGRAPVREGQPLALVQAGKGE